MKSLGEDKLKYTIGGIPFEHKDLYVWMKRLVKEEKWGEFEQLWDKIEKAIAEETIRLLEQHQRKFYHNLEECLSGNKNL
jgi:hypothetical protein